MAMTIFIFFSGIWAIIMSILFIGTYKADKALKESQRRHRAIIKQYDNIFKESQVNILSHELMEAVESEDFEKAAKLRDQIKSLQKVNS